MYNNSGDRLSSISLDGGTGPSEQIEEVDGKEFKKNTTYKALIKEGYKFLSWSGMAYFNGEIEYKVGDIIAPESIVQSKEPGIPPLKAL